MHFTQQDPNYVQSLYISDRAQLLGQHAPPTAKGPSGNHMPK